MSRRAGTVANARSRVGGNNATEMILWTNYSGITGNPLSVPASIAMTDAQSLRWSTNRMIGGPAHAPLGGFIHSNVEMEILRGSNRYNDDGTLISGADTSAASWSQEALENHWNANTQNWFTRNTALGFRKPALAMHTFTAAGSTLAFERRWDASSWGATTVVGALTPTAGSLLEDYIRYAKAGNTAGFGSQGFDEEQASGWAAPESSRTVQQTRDDVVLRGRQLAKITATYRSDPTGLYIILYKSNFTGSGNELNFYIAQNGAATDHAFDFAVSDSFMVGLASDPDIAKIYTLADEYYRLSYIRGNSSANDNDFTRIENAFRFDFGRRRARLSQCTEFASALTNDERLKVMRTIKLTPAVWPGDTDGNGPGTPTEFDRLLAGAVRWGQDGRVFQYRRVGNDESDPNFNLNQYEASYTSKLVPAFVDDRPTVTISSPASPHSSAGSTVTLQIRVDISTAVDRIEIVNQTTGVTYFVPFRWVNDAGTNWDPLSTAKLPYNTSLGLIPFHVIVGLEAPLNTPGDGLTVARALGANTIDVNVYSIHQRLTTATLISTRTS